MITRRRGAAGASSNEYAHVGQWLMATSGLVVGMIQVGALTRLTQSGLSMTTWSPLGGLPPMTLQAWQDEFQRYQQFPEWQQRQHNMTLRDFQYIYAWEYGHRMFGRVLGVVFVAPWMYFTMRGAIPKGYQGRMVGLLAMGGTQGLVGWWMVKSGLGEDRRGDAQQIRVKPLRLAAHLSMAFATYGALLWTAWDIFHLPHAKSKVVVEYVSQLPRDALRLASRLRVGSIVLTSMTAVTVVSGALVAGSDAGRAYNTFPTMDGDWIPTQVWRHLSPWWRNAYENTATIQWNHRVLATTTAVTAMAIVGTGLRQAPLLTPQVRFGLMGLGLAVTGQVTLGITTLLYYVPISLAALHQLGSVVVFTSTLYLNHSLRYARPAIRRAAAAATTTVASGRTSSASSVAATIKPGVAP